MGLYDTGQLNATLLHTISELTKTIATASESSSQRLSELHIAIGQATQELATGNDQSGRLTAALVRLNGILTWATVVIAAATVAGVGVAVFQAIRGK